MKRGKFESQPVAKKNNGKKVVSLLLVLVLLLGTVIGTTLAWLIDDTQTITNTFTFGNITIDLAETTGQTYKLTPGKTVAKDPKVTVNAGSEACWLFVKVTEANNSFADERTGKIVDWAIAEGWTEVTSGNGEYVYGRQVSATATNESFQVLAGEGDDTLKNGKVTVSDKLTQDDIAEMTATNPSLAFTAYAIQSADLTDTTADDNDTVDAIDAWTLLTAQMTANP